MDLKKEINYIQSLIAEGENEVALQKVKSLLGVFKNNYHIKHIYLMELLHLNQVESAYEFLELTNRLLPNNIYENNGLWISLFRSIKDSEKLVEKVEENVYLDQKNSISKNVKHVELMLEAGKSNIYNLIHLVATQYKEMYWRKSKKPTHKDVNGIAFFKKNVINEKRCLFVTGSARSGTSALGLMINTTREATLLMERFHPVLSYHPDMFLDQYMCFAKDEEHPHKDLNVSLIEKAKKSMYVGDKMPLLFLGWEVFRQNFDPNQVCIINISRDIHDIALSYEKRAENARKGKDNQWSQNRDASYACRENNILNKKLLEAMEDPRFSDSIINVHYDELFSSKSEIIRVFERLNLTVNDENRLNQLIENSAKAMNKKREYSQELIDIVQKEFDFESYDKIQQHSTV